MGRMLTKYWNWPTEGIMKAHTEATYMAMQHRSRGQPRHIGWLYRRAEPQFSNCVLKYVCEAPDSTIEIEMQINRIKELSAKCGST